MRIKNPKEKSRSASPIDAQKRALAEQESKLGEEIARRQKLIEEAPRLAEQAARRRREELIQRKSHSEARFAPPRALADPRYGYQATVNTPARPLRKHRNQGMFTFFALCIVLAWVVFYLYTKVLHGG
ncbi:MAG: hypothetical protein JWL90_2827 [Chthoniobacteraceae bacterium]|nr:hypothetical protein [Chthoniobacteraceae bacterium]MDB6173390.1 hypothetical protein [Chthoniobacteraceae bacterium]